jgi:uncharacterized protein YodC (DUF2158 family)
MGLQLSPGDVVRAEGEELELTVQQVRSDGPVQAVGFVGEELVEVYWLDPGALEVIWKSEREAPSFTPGDVVLLPSGGPYMTVAQGGKADVHCVWLTPAGLGGHTFDARVLWIVKPTHDRKAHLDPGDGVRLRSGGPSLTVEEGGDDQVRCRTAENNIVRLDARTLALDPVESERMTARELIAFARERGVALDSVCHSLAFLQGDRYIIFWRKTRNGVIYYCTQGRIEKLPAEFKNSASAFYGMWHEAGFLETLEEAFGFLRAWLLDGMEVDELPRRGRLRHGIG